MNTTRKFATDVGWTLSSSIIVIIIGMVLNIIIGNLFSAQGLGLYSITLTIFLITSTLASLGTHTAVIKYTAQYSKNTNKVNQLVSTGFVMMFLSGICFAVIVFMLSPLLANIFNMPQLRGSLRIIALTFIFHIVNKGLLGFLNGLREMKEYAIIESLSYILILMFTMIFCAAFHTIQSVIFAFPVAELLLFLILFLISRRHFRFNFTEFRRNTVELVKFGAPLLFSGMISQLNSKIDLLLIGYFMLDKDVGIYTAAFMFARGLMIFPSAIQRVTNPAITEFYYNNSLQRIENLVNTVMKYSFIILSVAAILLSFFFKDIIAMIYPGNVEFVNAVLPCQILLLSMIFYGTIVSVGTAVSSSIGRPDIALKLSGITLIINLALNCGLIPKYGIVGAAIATGISLILSFCMVIFLQKRLLKIRPHSQTFAKLIVLMLFVYLLLNFGISFVPRFTLLLIGLLILVVGLLCSKAINKQDISLLRGIIRK
jgi:O-antigen/teichoic acid export membrane protein